MSYNGSRIPSTHSEVDVLIIGAGPAGLFCANGLAKAGMNVRIIDKRPNKVAAGQADGIQPRTIEVLQSYGLADDLLEEAAQLHMAAFYNPGPNGGIECTGRAPDVTAPTARFPFEAILHQGEIEGIFLKSMAKYGCKVERPVVPISLEISDDENVVKDPNAHAVTVKLQKLEPEEGESPYEIVKAKYVLGADGAHSWVRKALGIAMEGEQTEYIWGVIDIWPDTDFPDVRNRCAIHSVNGSCMIIPRERDKIRLYIQLTNADVKDPKTGRVDLSKFGPEKLLEVAGRSFEPFRMKASGNKWEWWTLYIIGQRVAAKYSMNERVFIAGDACHTHSPKAGQGMNASMNDSHNLIWKLTHVLRGWADMSLLKTYEFERRKYAQDLISFDKKFSKLFSSKPKVAGTDEMAEGVSHAEFLEAFQTFGLFTSGIGIHYAPSPITLTSPTQQALASSLIIGQRLIPQTVLRAADRRPFEIQDLCPSDTRFKVLIFTGEGREDVVNSLAEGMESEKGGWYLRGKGTKMFDVMAVCKGKKEDVRHTDLPAVFRSHWSKVLLDDSSAKSNIGGKMYESYGIGDKGAIVVVRPDGYVGTVVPLDGMEELNEYFGTFMSRRELPVP